VQGRDSELVPELRCGRQWYLGILFVNIIFYIAKSPIYIVYAGVVTIQQGAKKCTIKLIIQMVQLAFCVLHLLVIEHQKNANTKTWPSNNVSFLGDFQMDFAAAKPKLITIKKLSGLRSNRQEYFSR
jgi:hypothetical protein